jgi:hypothetical protein
MGTIQARAAYFIFNLTFGQIEATFSRSNYLKELTVNLIYAVDRLYETGWLAEEKTECERLKDGRRYPTVAAVRREFERAGLDLSIKQNLIFKCYRAEWSGATAPAGTVVASCEKEAAVYALAQLRIAQVESQLVNVGEVGGDQVAAAG